jgi:hypothetical protein
MRSHFSCSTNTRPIQLWNYKNLILFLRRMLVVSNYYFLTLHIPLLDGDLWGLIENERK